ESLFGVTSRKDFVTSILKRLSDPGADAVLIFDEKDGFFAGEGRYLFGCARTPALRCDRCGTREVEIEPATFAGAARNANVSTGRHRVARIQGEIQDRLLNLIPVHFGETAVRVRIDLELDVLPDKPPQHVFEVLNDI